MTTATGKCLCGNIRFEVSGEPLWVSHCHCNSCRRSTDAPLTTFVGFLKQQVVYASDERSFFESSPGVQRGFCAACGTPLTYEADRCADETHLYISTLDRPEAFQPNSHVFAGESIAWLEVYDDLPRYREMGRPAETPLSWGRARKAST